MSAEYEGQDPIDIANQAERDLNSTSAKQGHRVDDTSRGGRGASDSTIDSGVDESVQGKFPGADVTIGSAASGAGDNREIPVEEGGGFDPTTGRPTKARDFEGVGGPEDKAAQLTEDNPGSDEIRHNIRQQ